MASAATPTESKLAEETNIIDLNDHCLIHICQNLEPWDLYALRETHNRFANATEQAYKDKEVEFDYELWLEAQPAGDLIKILKYFGHCMTRLCINESFSKFVEEKGVLQSHLSERLQNIRSLRLNYTGLDEINIIPSKEDMQELKVERNNIEFISNLKNIREFELIDNDWLFFQPRWPRLIKLTAQITSFFRPKFEKKSIKQLTTFILVHNHIEKLSIATGLVNFVDNEKLVEAVGTLRDLTELTLSLILPIKNENVIFSLDKLQKLDLGELRNIGLLKNLKNLKELRVLSEDFSIEELFDIVEAVPTLTLLKVSYEEYDLDSDALEILIEKRKMSPHCETEVLRIENVFSDGTDLDECFKRHEEYVSCAYRELPQDVEIMDVSIGEITPDDFIRQFAAKNTN